MTDAATSTTDRHEAGFLPPAGTAMSGAEGTLAQALSGAKPDKSPSDSAADAELVVLPPGAIVGERYVVERHISSGSFGAVYKASDRFIDNHAVALKLLHRPSASEKERETALRELRLLASVSHPSVVQFKDYGWVDGRMWFTMPWYEGITLQERILPNRGDGAEGEPVPEALTRKQARFIFERLAHGLAAMHEVGIHHHDIKPENIFLATVAGFDEGLPVLLDLGVAGESGERPIGFTAEYVPPETAAAALGSEVAIGPKADVFALALTLRNALCPESAPPAGGEAIPLLNKRAQVPVAAPERRELRYLEPNFGRWLSLDPDARPSAVELAGELSVLTQPEERREALRKNLWRTVPLVLLFGGMVLALSNRVEEQTAQLQQQQVQLTVQQREAERLRQETDDNLEHMEAQLAAMDEQDGELKRALKIARRLERRLRKADRTRRSVSKQLAANVEELEALQVRHDTLSQAQASLKGQYDALTAQHARLREAETHLAGERDALLAQRKGLSADLASSRRRGEADRARATIAEQQFQQQRAQLARLESQQVELVQQRRRAENGLSSTRRQLVELRAAHRALTQEVTSPALRPPPAPQTAPKIDR